MSKWLDKYNLTVIKADIGITDTSLDVDIENWLDTFIQYLTSHGFDFDAEDTATTVEYNHRNFALKTARGDGHILQIGAWTRIETVAINDTSVNIESLKFATSTSRNNFIYEIEKCCGIWRHCETITITGIKGFAHTNPPKWIDKMIRQGVKNVQTQATSGSLAQGQLLKKETSLSKSREYIYDLEKVTSETDSVIGSKELKRYLLMYSPYKQYAY